jgi:hypothetical protein
MFTVILFKVTSEFVNENVTGDEDSYFQIEGGIRKESQKKICVFVYI